MSSYMFEKSLMCTWASRFIPIVLIHCHVIFSIRSQKDNPDRFCPLCVHLVNCPIASTSRPRCCQPPSPPISVKTPPIFPIHCYSAPIFSNKSSSQPRIKVPRIIDVHFFMCHFPFCLSAGAFCCRMLSCFHKHLRKRACHRIYIFDL